MRGDIRLLSLSLYPSLSLRRQHGGFRERFRHNGRQEGKWFASGSPCGQMTVISRSETNGHSCAARAGTSSCKCKYAFCLICPPFHNMRRDGYGVPLPTEPSDRPSVRPSFASAVVIAAAAPALACRRRRVRRSPLNDTMSVSRDVVAGMGIHL